MKELFENKLTWVAIALLVFLGFAVLMTTVVADKVTNQVIERLQKEYSPGPYSPGFDPDKVNPNFWRNQQQNQPQQFGPQKTSTTGDWNADWERQRLLGK